MLHKIIYYDNNKVYNRELGKCSSSSPDGVVCHFCNFLKGQVGLACVVPCRTLDEFIFPRGEVR